MPFEVTKTELVWPGKYDDDGKRREPPRVSLPFQVIERVNESRATREAEKRQDLTLFDVWKADEGETFEEGWRNKLIWGDNALVMSSLLEQFSGKVDLIYIDPPFASGTDFSFVSEIGDGETAVEKYQSSVEEVAYRDTWGSGLKSYLSMMLERFQLIADLLSPTGTLYVHCDPRVNSHLRLLLDEILGADRFRNEVVWYYRRYTAASSNFQSLHDTLLRYSRSSDTWTFNEQREPYTDTAGKRDSHYKQDEDGRWYRWQKRAGQEPYKVFLNEEGKRVGDVWPIQHINASAHERLGYATQKPEELLTRVVQASSSEGDLIADFFCGSGTALTVAESLGRRWIGCDLSRWAIHVSRKRMLGLDGCQPFEILNLGEYERQYWQVVTFGEDLDRDESIALYEYVAFILKLYGATAVSGMGSLHGKTGEGFVHVGAVDSPVTIQEIVESIEECKAVKGHELHVLGWEWEMGVNDLMVEQAKQEGIKLLLRQIPREVMESQTAAKGAVRFFELAYVEFDVKQTRAKREFQVALKDFAIPNPELVPDGVRSKIKKWSDYVDYWAVDWEFRGDTFMQGWVTYRTRKDRSLELKSDPHTYEEPGEYAVMVKVIDIFGNDTSKVVRIQVK